jgi:hypothetical protein
MKNLKRLLAAASIALAMPFAASAAGAIAVDDEVGDTEPGYGFVTGYDTRDEAARAAMKECRKSGNKNCQVVARFDKCGAYASSKKYAGAGWGGTKRAAEKMALEKCGHERCEVRVSDCE